MMNNICQHDFETLRLKDSEVCGKCGVIVPHEYIIRHRKQWTMKKCADCGKQMSQQSNPADSCDACCDADERADRAVDERREQILTTGFDPTGVPLDDGWD
jgi:hypothetical protein